MPLQYNYLKKNILHLIEYVIVDFEQAVVNRGGSRTSPRRGRQSLGGRLPNILVVFSEKPYEIKEILVRKGGGLAPGAPSLNPPLCTTNNNTLAFFKTLGKWKNYLSFCSIPL